MPNIKSAKKRVKVSEKKNLRNRMIKSAVRTSVKKLEAAIARVRAAQKIYATYTQEQVDKIFKAAATAADNFQVVAGQRIMTRDLALIERRAIMPRPDFRAHQSPSRQASSPSLCVSGRRSSGGQQEYVR